MMVGAIVLVILLGLLLSTCGSAVEVEVAAAQGNAVRNGVDATFVPAVDCLPGPAQLVVANILAPPL